MSHEVFYKRFTVSFNTSWKNHPTPPPERDSTVWKHEYLALCVCVCVLCSVCIVAGLGQEIWLAGSRHQRTRSPSDRPGPNQGPTACQLDPEGSDPAAHSDSSRPNQNPKETWTQARQQGSRAAVHNTQESAAGGSMLLLEEREAKIT